jgi:hypothetical protein
MLVTKHLHVKSSHLNFLPLGFTEIKRVRYKAIKENKSSTSPYTDALV